MECLPNKNEKNKRNISWELEGNLFWLPTKKNKKTKAKKKKRKHERERKWS